MPRFCSTSRAGIPSARSSEHLDDVVDDPRRQPVGRLVEQQQPGVAEQRSPDREHLLLAAGQLVPAVAAAVRQPREQVVDALARPGAVTGRRPRRDAEVLLDGQRREDAPPLRDQSDARPRDDVRRRPGQLAAVEAH